MHTLQRIYKNVLSKLLLRRINKQCHIQITPTTEMQTLLVGLKTRDFIHLSDCFTIVYDTKPVLLNTTEQGSQFLEKLVHLSKTYSAKNIFEVLKILDTSQLIDHVQFMEFMALMQDFDTQHEVFLLLFNRLTHLKSSQLLANHCLDKGFFEQLLGIKGQNEKLVLLQRIIAKPFIENTFYKNRLEKLFSSDQKALENILFVLEATAEKENLRDEKVADLLAPYFIEPIENKQQNTLKADLTASSTQVVSNFENDDNITSREII